MSKARDQTLMNTMVIKKEACFPMRRGLWESVRSQISSDQELPQAIQVISPLSPETMGFIGLDSYHFKIML